jgi:predicted negative regulator of RcsB-dependent stress response
VTPSQGIFDASAQRLIDLGLSGVALLALGFMFWKLWEAREKDRDKAEARYEKVQESRVTEQAAALDAVSKALNTVETTIETLQRSHQQ